MPSRKPRHWKKKGSSILQPTAKPWALVKKSIHSTIPINSKNSGSSPFFFISTQCKRKKTPTYKYDPTLSKRTIKQPKIHLSSVQMSSWRHQWPVSFRTKLLILKFTSHKAQLKAFLHLLITEYTGFSWTIKPKWKNI